MSLFRPPRLRTMALAALVLVPLIAGGFALQSRVGSDGSRVFEQVWTLVSDKFVDTIDASALYEKAAQGLVHELNDPYTELYTPKRATEFARRTGGLYGGIGMEIGALEGSIAVTHVFPHTPAEEAGVMEGDRIVQVESASTRGWDLAQVSDSLTGRPGTKVAVRFQRAGVPDPIQFRFTRAMIHVPAVPFAIMLNGNIAYVPLATFNEGAAQDLEGALQRLITTQKAKGVVLDLRDDPGGILDQAFAVSNVFLHEGQEVVSVRGRSSPPQTFVVKDKPVFPSTPLVVLVNGGSASASEIVAGALQDHDRALILGTTSYGKGLVQTLFPLEGGYALKMTTAKWYTPSGRSIQKERKLLPDGEFVEVHPDSLESDSARRSRPAFKSDGGRTVYGGGAITPDVVVKPDTLTSQEQTFAKAVLSKPATYQALISLAFDLKAKVKSPSFTVQPEWRDDFFKRLTAAKIGVTRPQYDSVSNFVDRLIGRRLAVVAFGDSTEFRRDLDVDTQMKRAVDMLEHAQSQQDLFTEARQYSTKD